MQSVDELNIIKLMSHNYDKSESDKYSEHRNSFLERFIHRYGPSTTNIVPIRHGVFGEVPFTVYETRSSYSVEMEGIKKRFTNGWEAAYWVQSNK